MNVYPDEVTDSKEPFDVNPNGREQTAGGGTNSVRANRRHNRAWIAPLLVAAALAMGFGIRSLWRQLSPELSSLSASPEAAALAVLPEKSIAVLPLENLSEDKQNAFLADGLQDDIRSALAKVAEHLSICT